MSASLPASLAARVLNALLTREPWARERLRAHAGKTVRLALGGLALALRIRPEGQVEPGADAAANVSVRIDPAALPRLASSEPAERMAALHIEGEAALAQVAADLARDLRWDGEEELARVIGDLPARLLTRALATAGGIAREGASRLAQNAGEYATYEAGLLANPAAVAEWRAEAERLDERARALEARLDALARAKGRA